MDESIMLKGVTVLDASAMGPGMYATQLLSRMGARVIHIEPSGGNKVRSMPDMHQRFNAGKESVVADLDREEDRDFVLDVARNVDVFLEGWRPGVADRLGVGFRAIEAINSDIVYCSLSGYGHMGTLRDRPGHDINYLAASGLMSVLSGQKNPSDLPLPLADVLAGLFTAMRIVGGVLHTRASKHAIHIDASIAGAAREAVEGFGAIENTLPIDVLRSLPHYGIYRTADDAWLTLGIAIHENHFWDILAEAIGQSSWVGLSITDRQNRASDIKEELATFIGKNTRPELEALLSEAGTCWAFVESGKRRADFSGGLPFSASSAAHLGAHTDLVRTEFASDKDEAMR